MTPRSLFFSVLFGLVAIAGAQAPETSPQVPALITDALKRADAAIAAIVAIPNGQRTFDNTLGALDDMQTHLDDDTNLYIFLQNVSTDPKERDMARNSDEMVSNYEAAMGKREDLYKAIEAYADTKPKLQGEQARMLRFALRDYHRAGMDLTADARKQLLGMEEELNKLGIEFEQNIADDKTRVPFTAAQLDGVATNVLARLPKTGQGFEAPLSESTIVAIMGYAKNPETRHTYWLAYQKWAAPKNVGVLEDMLRLRAQHATMLGYKTTADYNVEPRMAKSAANIARFYAKLRPIVRRKAVVDYALYQDAKRADLHDPNAKLDPWDTQYYKNVLMKTKYAVDGQKVSEYFPMQRVVDGLLHVAGTLYTISFKDVTDQASSLSLPVWAPDVKLFEVDDDRTHQPLGHIYMDLFPRDGKYTHAACWTLKVRKTFNDGTTQMPLAALVCNFTRPTDTQPSLLPHSEVRTFFHEFGHGLHNLLSQAHYGQFAGTSVERDFVEAPSQMFENWVWDADVLSTFARHYQTGEPLPKNVLDGMLAAQTLGSGLDTEGQIYLGMVDQAYHTAPGGVIDTSGTGIRMRGEVTLFPGVPGTAFQAAFGHLVGYDAAYYGYQWSLVFAQDMFTRFQKLGLLNPAAGQYYRDKILSRGGSMDANDMLRDYLGRAPKMDAYLAHLGMK